MTDFEQRYIAARKAVIARDLARLNPMQRQGAMTTEGPLLLLSCTRWYRGCTRQYLSGYQGCRL